MNPLEHRYLFDKDYTPSWLDALIMTAYDVIIFSLKTVIVIFTIYLSAYYVSTIFARELPQLCNDIQSYPH